MRSKGNNKEIMSKYTKILMVLVILIILGIVVLVGSIHKEIISSQSLYSYEINRNANYKVYLKENNFFENEYSEQGKTYISSLVKSIAVDFDYNYKINKKTDFNYTYSIINDLTIKSESGNTKNGIIWSKRYELLKPTTVELKDNTQFSIKQNIDLDYNLYNTEAKKFVESYGMPADAYIDLKLQVYATNKINGVEELISEQSVIDLNMDLLEDTFNINENYKKNDTENKIKSQIKEEAKIDKPFVIIGISIIFVSGIAVLVVMGKISKYRDQNYYRIKVDKMLKKYEEVVARVVKPIEFEGKQIVDVKNFQQLLEIEDELRIPILFYETVKDEEGEFVIIYDNIIYRYIIQGRK